MTSLDDHDGQKASRRHWARVDRIFDTALDLDSAEREAYLVETCEGDAALIAEVHALLAAADRTVDLVAAPGEALMRAAWAEEETPERIGLSAGAVVGRYRIVSELGRGGMATVYEAQRADGAFEQTVALKLLRPGLDTEEVVRRFLAERQILSGLEHPNIARLIDGGATEDGRPYLVIERVKGEPITRWADAHKLDVAARLRLFLQAADAVQFAHRRLIIHRDLKPSNILVDETGAVKLLDFGIAKLLDPAEGADSDDLTRTGLRPLTPAYASPEQVRGERVTTASDVYQLGVLLYVLLTGRRPFVGRGADLAQAITTGKIRRPSDTTQSSGSVQVTADPTGAGVASPDEIAGARATTREGLRRTLRGDLDAIVLAALRSEPERRYASAADLAADVTRFLDRVPVKAQPDTFVYRTRRFVSRRPALAAALASVLLVAVAYVFTLVRHADRLERERDRAQTESAKAQQVSAFLIDLFRTNDPNFNDGAQLSAFELLERGEQRADRLAGQPEVHAQMLDVIGQMYTALGRFDRAEPMFRTSLSALRATNANPDVEVDAVLAGTLDRLGDLLQRAGRYAEADSTLLTARDLARLVGEPAIEADALTDYGHSLLAQGDYGASELAFRESFEIRLQLFGERDTRTANSLHGLGNALERQERFEEAESTYVKALDIRRQVLGPEHTQTTTTATSLARLYTSQQRLDEAEPLLREALDAARRRLGPDHVNLGLIMNELGMIAARKRDWPTAEGYFRESERINEAALGPMHAEVAVGLNNVSYTLIEQGRLEEALPLRRRVFEIARVAIGENHENTGAFAHNLGFLLEQLGNDREAETYYRIGLDILRRALPDGHTLTTRPMAGLGDLLARTGRAAEAETLLREALADRIAANEVPAAIAEVQSMLGGALGALGQDDEALEMLQQGLTGLEAAMGPDAVLVQDARERLERFRSR